MRIQVLTLGMPRELRCYSRLQQTTYFQVFTSKLSVAWLEPKLLLRPLISFGVSLHALFPCYNDPREYEWLKT